MREEIVGMCVDVPRQAGDRFVAAGTIMIEETSSGKFPTLLRDCRPILVIRELIAEVEAEREIRGFPPF